MTAQPLTRTQSAFTDVAPRSTPLYELSGDYVEVLNLLETADSDESGELERQLDALAGAITHKAEAIAGLVQQFEGMAAMRKAEAKRMGELSAADERRAERLRSYLLRHLQSIGTERIDTARFRISVRTNPPSVAVLEQQLVPAEYLRTVTMTTVDKRAILDALKTTGEVVPGVEIVRGTRLDIR
jgi:hypothetical protein